ncbi:serine hydrolase, partial [Candidatus Poribacteria bacterium]|nr:serine hydrolase [Candidatus Poribacteria bacterium]
MHSPPTPEAATPNANDALLLAVSRDDRRETQRLLTDAGADVNYIDEDGLTAHRIATAFGLSALAESLVEHGADAGAGRHDREALVDRAFSHLTGPGSPGAAVSVSRGGDLLYAKGHGLAHLEYDIPITSTTVFHVASLSKQVTAFSVALLASEGQLSLDDNIRAHLPEVRDFGATITLRHLVHHTSGLRDQWELLVLSGKRIDDVITTADIMTLVRHQRELNFAPGSEYLYCNTGYTLLAQIVERVTGESFYDWTRERLFVPLGMTRTHFQDDHERIVPNRAYSYKRTEDGYANSVLSFANAGATSLFTTVEDFAKWTRNLDTGELGGRQLVALMNETRPLTDGGDNPYAFGLALGEYRSLRVVEHGGSDAGFRSQVIRFPDHDLAVNVFGNMADLGAGDLARRVAGVYLADEMTAAESAAAADRPDAEVAADPQPDAPLDEYVGEYAVKDGPAVHVTRDGDRLVCEADGYPTSRPTADGGNAFSVDGTDTRLAFRRDAAGAMAFVTVDTGEAKL